MCKSAIRVIGKCFRVYSKNGEKENIKNSDKEKDVGKYGSHSVSLSVRQTDTETVRQTDLQSGGNFRDIPTISIEFQIPKKGLSSGFLQRIHNANCVEDT